jgi:ring-1,2-phenylacetyl-CoA epoxidase subunit PaaE
VHLSFHPLRLIAREPAALDAACLTLEVPAGLRAEYAFEPGQHVAVRARLADRELRRTYSIIDPDAGGHLRLGVRVQPAGGLSHYLAHELPLGEAVEALVPTGRFVYRADAGRSLLAVAGGSGITPILSIIAAALERDAASQVVLLYGNRSVAHTMFVEELLALKNRFLGRFAVHFFMSREPQEIEILNGRIDAQRLEALAGRLYDPGALDAVYCCGPGDLVDGCRSAMAKLGVAAPVHFERFATAAARNVAAMAPAATSRANDDSAAAPAAGATTGHTATITVIQDGRRRRFTMGADDESVLAAAERAGLELPYSCRAGVCSTCRVKVLHGEFTMTHNVALEDWELAAGFALACQLRPAGTALDLSYDDK